MSAPRVIGLAELLADHVAGRAVLDVDGARTPVGPGSVAHVPLHVAHRCVDVTEDLRVLVVLAPPEPG